ncbi:hypothetical protein DL89DRAFT_269082 [Linderina pennispora]|uniref:C2H2-type domain-containing protein n=1 Tax=Linderina pennispora TaxID=61395 RepID=A0A1Y1W2W7_9FUNG|nr:uncharacterized protein DL89DRAFT_269082 [Linderina pennispora]ORX67893.1 hypothetical protein DL89DRAFT_269082 [Linderina pennispora]
MSPRVKTTPSLNSLVAAASTVQRSSSHESSDPSPIAPHIPSSLIVATKIRRGRPRRDDTQNTQSAALSSEYQRIVDQIAHDASEDAGGRRRQFICTVEGCGKVFYQRAHLNIHIRSHTGYRPYVCGFPGCGKAFTQLGNMRTHERRHTGDRPFKCLVVECQKAFTQAGNLKTHMRKVHNIDNSPGATRPNRRSSTRKASDSPEEVLSPIALAQQRMRQQQQQQQQQQPAQPVQPSSVPMFPIIVHPNHNPYNHNSMPPTTLSSARQKR